MEVSCSVELSWHDVIVIRLQAGKTEDSCLNFWEEQEISVFSEVSTPALRPTQPPIQCIVAAFPWVKVVRA